MSKNQNKHRGITAVIGVDWGDSGKGRLIDDLAQDADIVARYNGGSNTGHTVQNKYGKFALHIIPSGIFNQKAICLVGRGVALDLESLVDDEMDQLKKAKVTWKNLVIDQQCTLTMPWHKLRDGKREAGRNSKIGTTGRGVGPTFADRTERVGLRVKDLISESFGQTLKEELEFQNETYNLKLNYKDVYEKFSEYAKIIKPFVANTINIVHIGIYEKKNILFEGAQGWFLDIDGGTYPFVTSSNPGIAGIWRSYDLHPSYISSVIGITKSYTTRVGNGPMPTKIEGPERQIIIEKGHEIGTTSGRTRDPGWLDLELLKYAVNVNKVTELALTKLDVLSGFKTIKVCVGYKVSGKESWYPSGDAEALEKVEPVYQSLPGWDEDISGVREINQLPKNARNYLELIEKQVGIKVKFIGVGPKREEVIYA
ncbi:adenylosuccinate synthase [Candidatus Curtissbacteria bacterium]|nr:adenylosuccinate synthase [Candidatus Curtissbacteria bacterium]